MVGVDSEAVEEATGVDSEVEAEVVVATETEEVVGDDLVTGAAVSVAMTTLLGEILATSVEHQRVMVMAVVEAWVDTAAAEVVAMTAVAEAEVVEETEVVTGAGIRIEETEGLVRIECKIGGNTRRLLYSAILLVLIRQAIKMISGYSLLVLK